MTRVELRRKAPEAQAADRCSVCGAVQPPGPRDHLLVGTPGVPSHDGAVCEHCGTVLEHVVTKFGGDLSVSVQDAKRQADGSDITVPLDPARAAHPEPPPEQ